MALDAAPRSSAEWLARAQAQGGLVEARCHRPECLNLMCEYRPVPGTYIRAKCRKCHFWSVFTVEMPG